MSLFIHNPRGFSLIETMIIGAITSVIILGTLKLYNISNQSVAVSSTAFAEQQLIESIKEGLSNLGDCRFNLNYRNLQGGNNQQGRGNLFQLKKDEGNGAYGTYTGHNLNTYDNNDIVLLEEGKTFKNSLHIVIMQLEGPDNLDVQSGDAVKRFFTVYYKKNNLGKFQTLEGRPCISSDLRGCYFQQYKVMYELVQMVGQLHYDVGTCGFSYCEGGACCYTVDENDETNPISNPGSVGLGRTLMGCKGTSSISKSGAVALGFEAGINNTTGFSNTFIGYKAGRENTTGNKNTFLGYKAGTNSALGDDNIFIGSDVGLYNKGGEKNTYIGKEAGKSLHTINKPLSFNTFIGSQAGMYIGDPTDTYIKGNKNTFIGDQAGKHNTTGEKNIFLGYLVGRGGLNLTDPNVDPAFVLENEGDSNIFIGTETGKFNSTGNNNIYIGGSVGPPIPTTYLDLTPPFPPPDLAGIKRDESYQFNIGNLILGKMPTDPTQQALQNSPEIPSLSDAGVVINGDLFIGKSISCGEASDPPEPQKCNFTLHVNHRLVDNFALFNHDHTTYTPRFHEDMHNPSSKEYKKNIKSFKNYEKALKDIVNTSLFTYEYKKDHPNKSRMGVISEELPKHLQMKGLDSRPTPSRGQALRGNDRHPHKTRHPRENGDPESKDTPSMPDWPSVYGTFWASIKTLVINFKNFKNQVLSELKEVKKQLISIVKKTEGNKKSLDVLNKQVQEAAQISKVNQKENLIQKKEFIEIKDLIKKSQAELEVSKQKLLQMKTIIQEGI